MRGIRTLSAAAAIGGLVAAATLATAATPAQFGARCAAAWTGSKTTSAYRIYRARCIAAAARATSDATDAGNPTNGAANAARARAACGRGFPAPRNTPAKRVAFSACVTAVSTSQRLFAGRPLRAALRGANEVPPAGPGSGSALIRLNEGKRRVCYTITASGLEGSSVTAAHIHAGTAGTSGLPVIGFANLGALDSGRPARGCVQNVSAAVIRSIRRHPGQYYLNVHTVKYGAGAARGQLTR